MKVTLEIDQTVLNMANYQSNKMSLSIEQFVELAIRDLLWVRSGLPNRPPSPPVEVKGEK